MSSSEGGGIIIKDSVARKAKPAKAKPTKTASAKSSGRKTSRA